VLGGCDGDHAQWRAEHMREAISGLPFWTKEGPISVSLSIGAITIESWNKLIPIEPFLKRVDAALYQAKAAGRDRVIYTAL
jgi:GGDEF domain-containing protein